MDFLFNDMSLAGQFPNVDDFRESVGRLMEFLTALGQDVQIIIRPAQTQHGEMSVFVG